VTNGVRRIEAITGLQALDYIRDLKNQVTNVVDSIKCNENDILIKLSILKENIKNYENETLLLQNKLANYKFDELKRQACPISNSGIQCVAAIIQDSNLKETDFLVNQNILVDLKKLESLL
jgi:alanyl-tRNA synthetase